MARGKPWSSCAVLALLLSLCACGKSSSTPSPSPSPQPQPGTTVTPGDRIGWDQDVLPGTALADYQFGLYVDGAPRVALTDASCAEEAGDQGHACSALLPPLTAGSHTLQIVAIRQADTELESDRSTTLTVNATGAAIGPSVGAGAGTPGQATTATNAERIGPFEGPVDLAFAPDGRLWIAERGGRIRVWSGRLQSDEQVALDDLAAGPGQGVLALAIDPSFEATGYVFLLYTARGADGRIGYRVVRGREVAGTIGEMATLLDGVPAGSPASGALRAARDGSIYVALGAADGSDPGGSSPLNGALLRLSFDGSAPRANPGGTPVLARGLAAPTGLAVDDAHGIVWVAGLSNDGAASVLRIAGAGGGSAPSTTTLLAAAAPARFGGLSYAAADEGSGSAAELFVASAGEDGGIARYRVTDRSPAIRRVGRLAASEGFEPGCLAAGTDGAVYFCGAGEPASGGSIGVWRSAADPRIASHRAIAADVP